MNEKDVKILLFGCGYWGKNWYNTIEKSPYNLVGVVDSRPLIEIKDCPLFNISDDISKLDFTHAIVSTPAINHYETIFKTKLPHNKILVEKPCCTNSTQCRNLSNIYPGYIFLHDPIYKYIENNLDKIGKPLFFKSIRASMGPRIRTDISIVEDYLVHDLYIYMSLFGNNIEVLSSFTTNFLYTPIMDDTAFILLRNKNCVVGNFFSSWLYPEKVRKIYIVGTNGAFIWDNEKLYFNGTHYKDIGSIDNYFVYDKLGNCNYELVLKDSEEISIDKPKTNLELELQNFINGVPLKVNINEVWNVIDQINIKRKGI